MNHSGLLFHPEFWAEDPIYFPIPYRIEISIKVNVGHQPNCYLVSLAVADCIVLVAAVPQEIVSYYLLGSEWIWGDSGCALSVFCQNLGINASSLCVAAFTVERYIAICKPFLAQTMCTCRRALKILLCVWIFAALYSTPWLFLTATFPIFYRGYPPLKMCDHKLSREEYLGYYFTDLVLFYLIPLLLCIFLYSKIAVCLINQPFNCSPVVSVANGQATDYPSSSSYRISSRIQVVKMLALVSALFAILWLPYRGLLVYNSVAEEKFMNVWYLMASKSCIYLNSAVNPILYNAMSLKFRKAFERALFLRNVSVQEPNQAYPSKGTKLGLPGESGPQHTGGLGGLSKPPEMFSAAPAQEFWPKPPRNFYNSSAKNL
ncbi:Thyrotropin-releasing hormone receptor [Orchesella cincta]|uniref:Thyrotropin-releasing hormone receptor n=1 Tax=Orchesella cincta TaxID=48709 RepID=A0A1D2M4Y5_ORCCI|nr:Thyrotropin-releasing hormone receptor [Orchesella cincta]